MYCGKTISATPKLISGDLYISGNAETYIEYIQNGQTLRDEVFPDSVRHINENSLSINHPVSD